MKTCQLTTRTGHYALQAALLTVLFFFLCATAAGQTSRGAIRGSVTDPSGAAVPNARVEARHTGTGITHSAVSTSDGAFTFVSLLPGTYELTAETTGCKKGIVNSVDVHIGGTNRADIRLELGDVAQSVIVSDRAVVITPDTAAAGTVVTSREYRDLPLGAMGRARLITDFALLTPGVWGGQQRPGGGFSPTTSLSVDGGETGTTDVLIDGMSGGQIQNFGSITEMSPPADAIQEFNLIKGAFSAEYGYVRTGLLSFSLKSGTNQLHGSVFHNFRNDDLNARSFFEGNKLDFHQNNFGATVSGPVRIPKVYNGRDRTFFMVSTDISRFRGVSRVTVYTSPTTEFLRGDFSRLKTAAGNARPIYDPATTASDGRGGVTRSVFPGNVIPSQRISPIAKQIAALIPAPNRPGEDTNFVARSGNVSLNNTYFNTKIDHRLNDRHSISSSFNYTLLPRRDYSNPYEGTSLMNGLIQDFGSRNGRLAHDFIITPKTLNHLQLGYNRTINRSTSYSRGEDWPARLGLKGVGGDGSLPQFSFSDGYPTIGHQRWDADVQENIMFRNTTTFLRGKHNVKAGFEMRRQWYKRRNWGNQGGSFSFRETALNNSSATGNSFASFLLGWVDAANISTSLHIGSLRPYYASFVQDDIKLTPRLTLNLGVRHDLDLPPREQYDRMSIFDLGTPNPGAGNRLGALIFAGDGPGRAGRRTFQDPYYRAFAPRVGLAYTLRRTTVLRLGYGISFSPNELLFTVYDGYSSTANFVSPDLGNSPAFLLDSGMPTDWPKPPFITPTFSNNNNVTTTLRGETARMPMTQNWRLDLQQELPGGTVIEAAYVGTRGTHLTSGLRNLNQVDAKYLSLGSVLTANITSAAAQQAGIPMPYPGYTGTVRQALRPYPHVLNVDVLRDKLGSSIYHSFQLKAQKRFAAGLYYLVSYTNSKLMTDVGTSIQDAGNRRAEWALASFDTPQILWTSAIYELPFGHGKRFFKQNRAIDALLGGWSISGVVSYQSGAPMRPSQSNTLALFNTAQRPNRVAGVPVRNDIGYGEFDPAVHLLYNLAAFRPAATNQFGDSAPQIGDARAFGMRAESMALRKNTRVTEQVGMEFNIQAFNLFNRPNWGGAGSNISSTGFGKVTAAGPGRFVQLGLKLHF